MICSHIEKGMCYFLRNKSKTMAHSGCHKCMIISCQATESMPFPAPSTILGISNPVQESSRAPICQTNKKLTITPFFPQIYSESFHEPKNSQKQMQRWGWSCRSRDIKDKRFKVWPIRNLKWSSLVDSRNRLLPWTSLDAFLNLYLIPGDSV